MLVSLEVFEQKCYTLPCMRNQFELRLITRERILTSLILFLLTFVFLFSFLIQPAQAGLGFSPGVLLVEGVMPNTSITQQIVFSRENATKPSTLKISLEGLSAQYIAGPSEITFEAGQNEVPYIFTINPGSLPEGEYSSRVSAVTTTSDSDMSAGGAGASIILAGYPLIKFTVSNKSVQNYSINDVRLSSAEEHQPVGFSYYLQNDGNVASRPDHISIKFTNQANPTELYEEVVLGEQIEFVGPMTSKNVSLFFKTELLTGTYLVDFDFFDQNGVLHQERGLSLEIFPAGTFAQEGILEKLSLDKDLYAENELIQFSGTFNNTGDIGLSASLVLEFFLDDKRVDLVKSDAVFVPPRRTADFNLEKRFLEGGDYRVKGYVNYGINNTQSKELFFTVGTANNYVVIITLVGFVFLLFFLILLFKRRKNKTPLQSNVILPPAGSPVIISPSGPAVSPSQVSPPENQITAEIPNQPINNLSNEQMNNPNNNSTNTPNKSM